MLTRRRILTGMATGAMALGLPGLAFGRAATDARFVLVILRGAMDGLGFAPPFGDGAYARLRGELALAAPGSGGGALKLDGLFGLHPSLPTVHELYRRGDALLVHAVASPYRERSHFDGQDVLENGAASAGGRRDGWLNRALAALGGSRGAESAVALAQTTPLVLRGEQPVSSWAPSGMPGASDDTLERLAMLYGSDEFFGVRLQQALDAKAIAGETGTGRRRVRGNDAARFEATMSHAARFLSADDGAEIAVVESGGWDTHANQGAERGALAGKLRELDTGIAALEKGLGPAWQRTVVVVATEFGRTVAVNGTRGTDHGTATVALVAGGAVNGGRVMADWPGLGSRDLHEGRDLKATTDLRSIFKAVLVSHLGLQDGVVEDVVFPHSTDVLALHGMIG